MWIMHLGRLGVLLLSVINVNNNKAKNREQGAPTYVVHIYVSHHPTW